MSWIGLNKAQEKMDGLGQGSYRQAVAEPRGAVEDNNGHGTARSKRQTTGTQVASQTRERMASHHSIPTAAIDGRKPR